MNIEDYNVNVFKKFDKEWALVTAGDINNFNTMTISWGSLGTLWNKPVVTIYIRESRYTHEFLDKNNYFTVSFYSDEYKKDLVILGSKSGRDTDKIKLTNLTPKNLNNTITFNEASTTIVCKKLYVSNMDASAIPNDIKDNLYKDNDTHTMFIGEVIDILE